MDDDNLARRNGYLCLCLGPTLISKDVEMVVVKPGAHIVNAVAGQRDAAPVQLWSPYVYRDDPDWNGGGVLQRPSVEHRFPVVVAKGMDPMKGDSPRQEKPQHTTDDRGTGETCKEAVHGLKRIAKRAATAIRSTELPGADQPGGSGPGSRVTGIGRTS